MKINVRRIILSGSAVMAGALLLIQVVPYGRQHENPPSVAEPVWDSSQTREIAARACFDCHSNQTRWPWYSNVAPASWLLQRHVDEGRRAVNFSEWTRRDEKNELAEAMAEGEMPPASYMLLHPEARLSETEKRALTRGLSATLAASGAAVSGDDD